MERFPPPAPPRPADDIVVRKLSLQARKLAADLKACKKIPAAIAERAAALAEDVEEVASQVSDR